MLSAAARSRSWWVWQWAQSHCRISRALAPFKALLTTPQAGQVQVADSWFRWVWKGTCVSGMNPKVFLLFLALLPQFTDPLSTWPVPAQIMALGALHGVSCAVVYLLVGFSARAVLQTRPGAAKNVSRVSGAVMIIIALILLAEQVLH